MVAVLGLQEKPEYSNNELPGYSTIVPEDMSRILEFEDEWDDQKISSVLYFSESEQTYYVQFIDRYFTNTSDLLLYLNEDSSIDISDSSKLIGSFIDDNSVYYKLPSTQITNSSIILFSLPKKEVIATAKITKLESSE
jgi:hypothetical protein